MGWKELGSVDPGSLEDARLQLHWAAQLVAAAGQTFLDPGPDESHIAMQWLPDLEVLAGRLCKRVRSFRVALRPRDLNLLLLDEAGNVIDDHPLDSRSFHGAKRWVRKSVAALTAGAAGADLMLPDFEMPAHGVGSGDKRFDCGDAPAFHELARWYADAADVLGDLATEMEGAGEVMCWPKHLDIATVIALDKNPDGLPTHRLHLGVSPGGASYPAPHAYAYPSPAPPAPEPGPLEGGGHWHSEGWFGGVLTAEQLIGAGSAAAQEERLRSFVQSALSETRLLLGMDG